MRYSPITSAPARPGLSKLVWSIALPALLLLVFIIKQFIQLDFIGWSHGFNHPLEGWDHLVTMLAVGIWAAQMRGHAIWMLPLAFVSVMSLGGLVGAAGIAIPNFEGIILLSCAVFGVLITRNIRFSSKINVLIVAFFAFFHGFAHGQEISTSASLISYTLGFMVATLLLHGAGIIFAKLIVIGVACLLSLIVNYASHASTVTFETSGNTKSVAQTQNNPQFYAETWRFNLDDPNLNASDSEQSNLSHLSVLPKSQQCSVHERSSLAMLYDQTTQHSNFVLNMIVLPYGLLNDALIAVQFNQYFPDINNSPGVRLLAGGVGITSPPQQSNFASALPRLSNPFQIEVTPLQFANPLNNSNQKNLISFKPVVASHFWHKFQLIFEHLLIQIFPLANFCADTFKLYKFSNIKKKPLIYHTIINGIGGCFFSCHLE